MVRTRPFLLLLLPGLLLPGLVGCGGSQSDREALAEEIEINRAVWEAQRPDHYRFVLSHQCFCGPEALGPVELEVVDGVAVRRTYVSDGTEVPASLAQVFPNISGLFDLLAGAVETGADEIQVTWDPATGVPRQLFVDYQVNVADEEEGYRVDEGPEEIPAEEPEP